MTLRAYGPEWRTTGDPPAIGSGKLIGAVSTSEPIAVFVGDSYTAGAGASSSLHRFTNLVAAAQGWAEVNYGRGGTGYLTPITDPTIAMIGCGYTYCPSYPQMIAQVAAAHPAVVVVSGGRNDMAQPWPDIAAGVADFYTALRESLPSAAIVATSPIWDTAPPPERLVAMCTAVRRAVTAVGGVFVDIGDPLQGHAELIAADGVHPNDAGHDAIATAFQEVFRG